jgi:DNA-binding MarR family transcriptional regulator
VNDIDRAPDPGATLTALLEQVWQLNRMAAIEAPGDHSPSQYRTLGLLMDSGPRRVGDLADEVHVSQPAMSKIVHALVDAGAVERERDPQDSRVTLVSITDAGRALIAQRSRAIVEQLLPAFTTLSAAEHGTLQHAVEILSTLMSGARVTPGKEAR